MQKVLTAEDMREVDRLTTEKYAIPSIILMENAANGTARVILEKLGGSVEGKSFVVLCGKGNNGGDGAALARILWTLGADCFVYLFGKLEETKGDARTNFEIVKKLCDAEDTNGPNDNCLFFNENSKLDSTEFINHRTDVLIDGLFGTGLNKPISGDLDSLVERINIVSERLEIFTVSLDIPSGLSADSSNKYGNNISSDCTVTFTAPKLANVLPPASDFNGDLSTVNIGSPPGLIENCASSIFLAERKDAQNWLRKTRFSNDSYKNKRGNVLMIVGSRNYTGAAVLAVNAAMESGVGLVTVATSESAQISVSKRVMPEIVTQGLKETKEGSVCEDSLPKIRSLSEKADVLAVGCGLGWAEQTTRKLVLKIVEKRTTPIVVDADGLNSLSPFELQGSAELPLILTPHEGEFKRLMGRQDKDAIDDRVRAVRDFSREHNVMLVLKGERTLIGEPNGKVVINPTGNSGLGKAGNGDNLTGIITGFIAQSMQENVGIFETIVAAVYVAGFAGDVADKKFGKRTMQASDVRDCLKDAFEEMENG